MSAVELLQKRASSKYSIEATCWVWKRALDKDGYGVFSRLSNGKHTTCRASRLFFETYNGEIPEGLVVDHLCRNRACVNPEHLEAVTIRQNTLRGEGITSVNAKKTHCRNGHELTEANIYSSPKHPEYRDCLVCRRDAEKRSYLKRKVLS